MVGLGRSLRGQSAAEQFLEANALRPSETTVPPAPTTEPQAVSQSTTTSTTLAAEPAGPPVKAQLAALDTLDDDVAGISSYVTPNDSFYRIDTAFGRVPQVDPGDWRLRFTGMVDNPYEIGFEEIQAMDLSDYVITLSCVSNEVGGNLVGNAVWTGVPSVGAAGPGRSAGRRRPGRGPLGGRLDRRLPDRGRVRRPQRHPGHRA